MNILYLNQDRGIPVLGDKGASVHVRSFVTAAAKLGHDVVLACATLGAGNAPPPARMIELPIVTDTATLLSECSARFLPLETIDDPVLRREIALLAHDRALPGRLFAALDGIGCRPDLVYERHALFSRAGVAIAARFGVPRLLEINAPLIEEQKRFRDLRLIDEARMAEAASYHGADAIVAVSEAVAAHVRNVLGADDTLHVIANGVDLARFHNADDGAAIRARLGIGGGPVIGFIGSFKPWHGVDFLFDAFAGLAPERPDMRLVAVGDGPDLPALRTRAAAPDLAGRVILPGRVPHADIPAWLAAMDITVAPYIAQPDFYFSPLKIVESLAAGRPVIAPRIGQIADLIDDGETGLLYPPGNAASCRQKLRALIDDPANCRAMGRAARRAAAGWDWTAVVERALSLAPIPTIVAAL